MRTHCVTLDDEASEIARNMGNFSAFVRHALKHQGESKVADMTDPQRVAVAINVLQGLGGYDHVIEILTGVVVELRNNK